MARAVGSTIVNIIYLYIACFTTYSIIQKKYYEIAIYKIGALMCGDLVLNLTTSIKIKPDMILHHIFVLGFIAYFLTHMKIGVHHFGQNTCADILRGLLTTEVSTVFLMTNGFLKSARAPSALIHINNGLFVGTFFYYRLYLFYMTFLRPGQTFHIVIFTISNKYWIIEFMSCIYGLYALNLYWGAKIVQKFIGGGESRAVAATAAALLSSQ
jgi:hypothetical protein